MEFLMKELEVLLKQDGLGFLTPVIGFYCHKCEEFIGDLSTAERHAALHRSSGVKGKLKIRNQVTKKSKSEKPPGDKHPGHKHPTDGKTDSKKDSKKHNQREWKGKEKKPSSNATNVYLKEKLQAERMLITVSCGAEPANQNARGKREQSCKREREESSRSSRSRSRSRSWSTRSSSSEDEREKKQYKKKKKKSGKKKKKNKK